MSSVVVVAIGLGVVLLVVRLVVIGLLVVKLLGSSLAFVNFGGLTNCDLAALLIN